jgi:hypothetical protein
MLVLIVIGDGQLNQDIGRTARSIRGRAKQHLLSINSYQKIYMAQVDKIFTQAMEKWDLQPFSDLSTTSSQPKPCRDLPRNVPTVVY